MTAKEAAAAVELGVVPNAAEVFGKALARFVKMVDEREGLREIEKQSKEERGYTDDNHKRFPGIDDKIKDMLADLKKVMLPDGRSVQVVDMPGREFVDVKMLLEAGVTADIIQRCKKRSTPSWHIRVYAARE